MEYEKIIQKNRNSAVTKKDQEKVRSYFNAYQGLLDNNKKLQEAEREYLDNLKREIDLSKKEIDQKLKTNELNLQRLQSLEQKILKDKEQILEIIRKQQQRQKVVECKRKKYQVITYDKQQQKIENKKKRNWYTINEFKGDWWYES